VIALFDRDWRRISRWCFLGVIVMCVWLLVPVGKCSYQSFRDIPLDEIHPTTATPGDANQRQIDDGKSFFGSWVKSIRYCYERTPLMGQEEWKSNTLVGLVAATVLAWGFSRLQRKQRPRLS
jgi:hypothetical protein